MAHRCIEWDGWEEGLVDSILGPEDQEEDWFKEWREEGHEHDDHDHDHDHAHEDPTNDHEAREEEFTSQSPVASISPSLTALRVSTNGDSDVDVLLRRTCKLRVNGAAANGNGTANGNGSGNGVPVAKVVVAVEKEREKLLNATGDFCGGRGGELGRRLEAWLYVNGDGDGRVDLGRRWKGDEED